MNQVEKQSALFGLLVDLTKRLDEAVREGKPVDVEAIPSTQDGSTVSGIAVKTLTGAYDFHIRIGPAPASAG